MEYYTVMKSNKLLIHAITWMTSKTLRGAEVRYKSTAELFHSIEVLKQAKLTCNEKKK